MKKLANEFGAFAFTSDVDLKELIRSMPRYFTFEIHSVT